jgi:hypothetical protein
MKGFNFYFPQRLVLHQKYLLRKMKKTKRHKKVSSLFLISRSEFGLGLGPLLDDVIDLGLDLGQALRYGARLL